MTFYTALSSVGVCRSLFHQDYSVDGPEGEDVATLLCGVTTIEREAGTSLRGIMGAEYTCVVAA